jgi:hypothetical protein
MATLTIEEMDIMLKALEKSLENNIFNNDVQLVCALIRKFKIRTVNGRINEKQTKELLEKYDKIIININEYINLLKTKLKEL